MYPSVEIREDVVSRIDRLEKPDEAGLAFAIVARAGAARAVIALGSTSRANA